MEVHHVVTEDGYILELHRIPYGQRDANSHKNSTFIQRRAVFLQHGMMGTDHFWLVGSTNKSLGKCLIEKFYRISGSFLLTFYFD